MKNIALMASGEGTNVIHLLENQKTFELLKIKCVISDNPQSPLFERLPKYFPEIDIYLVEPNSHFKGSEKKREHEERILQLLAENQIEWVALAGYMRLIGPTLLAAYPKKIINIHPSLLPQFPGLHAYERAYESGQLNNGVTIHYVDEGMDTGEIIAQESFARLASDTLADFIARGKRVEWQLYPAVLKRLAT